MKRSACAALGASGLLAALQNLRLIQGAYAAAPGSIFGQEDYKALICIFLYGGNDGDNMVIPYSDDDYGIYRQLRSGIALERSSLLPLDFTGEDGRQFAFHPSMTSLQELFNSGQLAVLGNVGTLVGPTSRNDFINGTAALPPQLFSHNDQAMQWQTGVPDSRDATGWGGRMADLIHELNSDSRVSTTISVAGSNTFQVGQDILQYQITPYGTVGLDGFQWGESVEERRHAFEQMLSRNYANIFESSFAEVTERAIETGEFFNASLASADEFTAEFPDTYLGNQLKMIARTIAARKALGLKRQIFFCSTWGYDTHTNQAGDHANLLSELSESMSALFTATQQLGISDSVTSFTASDFGRTYIPNGAGTDHGWGGHQLIMGGSVDGGSIYGSMPSYEIDGPNDTYSGRWIPSTSVDEYSSTLARWFGLSAGEVRGILPNIGRFGTPDLGFMKSL